MASPDGILKGDIPEVLQRPSGSGSLLYHQRTFSILSTSRAARHQLSGEGKGCALPWSVSAEWATRNHSGAAAAGRKERRKTHQTGPLLTQSVIGAGGCCRAAARAKLPDRRQDGTALSVAQGVSFAQSISRMEMGVTVRKHDEASANELTR